MSHKQSETIIKIDVVFIGEFILICAYLLSVASYDLAQTVKKIREKEKRKKLTFHLQLKQVAFRDFDLDYMKTKQNLREPPYA